MLQFRIDAGDMVLEEHFRTASKNCTYRSKTTQNQLVQVCGDYIRNKLLREIREAFFFSISADEVADLSNKEQMSLVARFIDTDLNIREEFLGFATCDKTDGETLASIIIQKFRDEWGLTMENCRGQTYDGAGSMAGCVRGISTRIQAMYSKALYTHCTSHVLNLCVVNGLDLRIVKNMMGLADSIAKFFKNSPKRQVTFEITISDVCGDNGPKRKKLKQMCRTRWVERLDAFEVFVELYPSVAKCLEEISVTESRSWNRETVADARSLYLGMTD